MTKQLEAGKTAETVKVEAEAAVDPGDSGQVSKKEEPTLEVDESGWDEKTKTYIKQLRAEAAKNRTKAKEMGDQLKAVTEKVSKLEGGLKQALGVKDETTPEEAASKLTEENATLAFHTAVLESAMEHGIGKEQIGYYKFLISEKAAELEDGQELTDEDMAAIIKQVQGVAGKKPATSSVQGVAPDTNQGTAGGLDLTAEKFAKMTVTEKSQLFVKNQSAYNSLMAEARAKKLL